jgi:phospholipase D1/2
MDAEQSSILRRGRNCWRIERADRLALIVDAAGYFAAAKAAIRKARQAVMLIGWQFDLHIKLEPDRERKESPDELGEFLKAVAAERPELRIHILQWDAALLATVARQVVPFLMLELVWRKRIHFRLDTDHPPAPATTRRSSSSTTPWPSAAAST